MPKSPTKKPGAKGNKKSDSLEKLIEEQRDEIVEATIPDNENLIEKANEKLKNLEDDSTGFEADFNADLEKQTAYKMF